MKTALAQINCAVGDVKSNCARISEYAKRAANDGCDIVIFPEMSDTGYVPSIIKDTASSWPGLPYSTCCDAASDNNIYLICGLSEREGDSIFNSAGVFSPEGGLIGKYRKTHLFPADPINENLCFKPGNSLTTVEIGGVIFGLTICYDLRFPEIYRGLALKGAQVLVNCSAWPETRAAHWEALSRARAIENQEYFLGANRIGKDGKVPFCGRSCIIEPWGDYAAVGSAENEELVIGEIDIKKIESFRKKVPVFKSRRPDIYGGLIK